MYPRLLVPRKVKGIHRSTGVREVSARSRTVFLLIPTCLLLVILLPPMADALDPPSPSTSGRQSETVEISVLPALREVKPGSKAIFAVTVSNHRSETDVLEIDIHGGPENWTLLLTDRSLEVSPGSSEETTLTVTPSEDAVAGDATISVEASSTTGEGSSSTDLVVRVEQIHSLDLFVSGAEEVSSGDPASYTVTVTNTGNGPDNVTLTIIPTGEATAWATPMSTEMELKRGAHDTTVQNIKVPSDVESGTYTFTFRARSSSHETTTEDMSLVVRGSSPAPVLDDLTLTALLLMMFIVLAIVAAYLTPSRREGSTPDRSSRTGTGSREAGRKMRKVKKKRVKRATGGDRDRPDGDGDGNGILPTSGSEEIHDRLKRMESRIEEIHDRVREVQSNHDSFMGHFQLHLIRHHGERPENAKEPESPPDTRPGPELEPMADTVPEEEGPESLEDREDKEMGGEDEVKVLVKKDRSPEAGRGRHEDMTPSPPGEDHPVFGPPESMSVGDGRGSIRQYTPSSEGLGVGWGPGSPGAGDETDGSDDDMGSERCGGCGVRVEDDWVKCPECGSSLTGSSLSEE